MSTLAAYLDSRYCHEPMPMPNTGIHKFRGRPEVSSPNYSVVDNPSACLSAERGSGPESVCTGVHELREDMQEERPFPCWGRV